ncbi:MAG TPA: NADP-dependent oxidoreductase, partial [Steroidobacteraceae bacterium]|nr:NADP-dependent oxidoreductase [Steroidobacteraceae bacterium]
LGVLGMPGLTGYVGMVYLGEPKPGQTVVVSAPTGPVGSTAGQAARLVGARAVGVAGSDEKCDYAVRELGYAACVNYRKGELVAQLKAACPDGIDVYFDNVGGEVLAAVLRDLAMHARIVLCGMIEAYSMETPPPGPFLGPVVGARATMQGLIVYDHLHRLPELIKVVGAWIRAGQFHYREDVSDGLDSAPEAFCRLMRGQNFGKALVRVGPERVSRSGPS